MHAIMLITIYLKAILELPKTSSMNSQRNFASLNMLNIGSNILAKFHNFDSFFYMLVQFPVSGMFNATNVALYYKMCFRSTDKIQIECYVKL